MDRHAGKTSDTDTRRLLFITGNPNKLKEARMIMEGFKVDLADAELPELQEMNEELIVTDKIRRAMELFDEEVFVEDSSICFDALGGLPGPLVKWFEKTAGLQGMVDMISAYSDKTAYCKSYIGYGDPSTGRIEVFEGVVKGRIVEPAGENGFGWDKIFVPEGHEVRFSEMPREEKNKISHRMKAFNKFKDFLEKIDKKS